MPDGVTDDFITSTQVIRAGRRLVFEPEAVALEPVASSSRGEYGRKVRIMTRGLRGVAMARELLDPGRFGFYSLQLLTHKILRRLMAVPLLVIAATSVTLWDDGPLYRLAVVGQAMVYGLGAIGLGLRGHPAGRRPWFSLPAFFVLVNVASLHAVWNLAHRPADRPLAAGTSWRGRPGSRPQSRHQSLPEPTDERDGQVDRTRDRGPPLVAGTGAARGGRDHLRRRARRGHPGCRRPAPRRRRCQRPVPRDRDGAASRCRDPDRYRPDLQQRSRRPRALPRRTGVRRGDGPAPPRRPARARPRRAAAPGRGPAATPLDARAVRDLSRVGVVLRGYLALVGRGRGVHHRGAAACTSWSSTSCARPG